MEKYVNLEKLMEFPIRRDHCDKKNADPHFINGIEAIFEWIEQIAKTDSIEIVRCKNCKYYEEIPHDPTGEIIICGCRRGWAIEDTEPDGYCIYGEIEDEENEE